MKQNEHQVADSKLLAAANELLACCLMAIDRLEMNNYHGEEDEYIQDLQNAVKNAGWLK